MKTIFNGVKIKFNCVKTYQKCKVCVLDTTDEDISFDENGICNRCNKYKNRIEHDLNYGK